MVSPLGLEALLQRGQTPLFKDLVQIYQESFDALKELPRSSKHDEFWIVLHRIGTAKKITARIQQDFPTVFTGTDIVSSDIVNLGCQINITKAFVKSDRDKTKTTGMMIAEIARLYDDKTAKLGTVDVKRNPFAFSFRLLLYTSLWQMRNQDNTCVFTAEMLAAGTLHEIGHMDQLIRAGLRAYGNTLDAADIVQYVKVSPDPTVVNALLAALKTSNRLDKTWKKILLVAETQLKEDPDLKDPVTQEALAALGLVVNAELSARHLVTINDDMMGAAKSSVLSRVHNRLDMERSSDDFAARSGAAAPLAQFLYTMNAAYTTNYHQHFDPAVPAAIAMIARTLILAMDVMDVSMEDINMGYDPMVRRLQLILETAKHAFSDAGLSSEAKADLAAQIKEGETYIKAYLAAPHQQMRMKLKAWCDKVGVVGRILSVPFENRLSRDYEKLQEAQRSLSRHPLYYLDYMKNQT
jgi:hypothetical protein